MLRKLLNLLSDTAIYGVSTLLSQLIGFLLLPLYTRFLTPADYYVTAMMGLLTAFFWPLANLGMINAIFRRFSFEKDPVRRGQILSTGLYSVVFMSCSLALVGLALSGPIAQLLVNDAAVAPLVNLSLLTGVGQAIGAVALATLRADRRVKTMAAINVAKVIVGMLATIYLVTVEQIGVRGVIIGSLLAEVALLGVELYITRKLFVYRPTVDTWRRMASYGLPFVPHQLQTLCMGLFGQFVVGQMLNDTEGGLYSVAVRFALPVSFVVNSINTAWGPFKFHIHAEDENPTVFFRTVVTYYVAGLMYLWVGVSLWGPELVWLMTTEKFFGAAWLVPAVGLIPVSQGMYFMMGTGIELSENTRAFPVISFFGLLAVVCGSMLLVPRLGAIGAAIATVLAWGVSTCVIYRVSQRRLRIVHDWPALISLMVLAAAAVGAAYANFNLPGPQRIAVAVGVSLAFPAVEFLILSRSPTERDRMRILWSKVVSGRRRATI